MNKKLLLGMFAVFFIVLSVQSVYAIDILDSVLKPFRGTDVGKLYDTYSLFIDAILYLLLFLGLAQMVYVKAYGKKEGKIVAIAVALALAFSMAWMESNTGFRLGSLMPIGAIILIFVLFVLLFNLFQGIFNDTGASFSLAFLIMYAFLMSAFKPLYDWLEAHAPLLAALIQIAMIISFIILIIKLVGMFKGGDSKDTPSLGTTTPTLGGGGGGGKTPITGTIDITSPSEGQNFNAGDAIRVVFTGTGNAFNKNYDYEVRLNGIRHLIQPNVGGPTQVMPGSILAGTQARVGTNVIQVNALKRGFFGGSNSIIAQSPARNFTVGPGGPGGGGGGGGGGGAPVADLVNLISVNLETALNDLAQAFINYQRTFNNIITINAGGRLPTPTEWGALITDRQNLLDALERVNRIIDAITLHTAYASLTPTHLAVLASRVNRSNILRASIITYEITAIADFNIGRMPTSPTP